MSSEEWDKSEDESEFEAGEERQPKRARGRPPRVQAIEQTNKRSRLVKASARASRLTSDRKVLNQARMAEETSVTATVSSTSEFQETGLLKADKGPATRLRTGRLTATKPLDNNQMVGGLRSLDFIDDELDRLERDSVPQAEEEEKTRINLFVRPVEQILWRKWDAESNKFIFLCKMKQRSYLHCEWLEAEDIIQRGKQMKTKFNRFIKAFDKRIEEGLDVNDVDAEQFDPNFIKVEKILGACEIFPIIHPKKANEIKNKWSEYLTVVCSQLLNFSNESNHYGLYLSKSLSEIETLMPSYLEVPFQTQIPATIFDVGTINNRVYLEQYKNPYDFWTDLGRLMKFITESTRPHPVHNRLASSTSTPPALEPSDFCRVFYTLKYFSVVLYRDWFALQSERYETIKSELQVKRKTAEEQAAKDLVAFNLQSADITNKLYGAFDGAVVGVEKKDEEAVKLAQQNYQAVLVDFARILGDKEEFAATLSKEADNLLAKITDPGLVKKGFDKMKTFFGGMIKKRVEMISSIKQPLMSDLELSRYYPGDKPDFSWIGDIDSEFCPDDWLLIPKSQLDTKKLLDPIDKVYLVKWQLLGYAEITWEKESDIDATDQLNEFRMFNRSLDKDTRTNCLENMNRHIELLDLNENPKKRARISWQHEQDMKNKLYQLNIKQRAELFQYTSKTMPIFKDKKLLRNYQLESVNWLIESWFNNRNVILADEMGLGKTIQAIAFLNFLYSFQNMKGPFLIIAPLSTLAHWKRTVENWSTMNSVLYYDVSGHVGREKCRETEFFTVDIQMRGGAQRNERIMKFHILITSFEVFLQDMDTVLRFIPFQHIVIDEAHRLKNQNAKILNALRKLPCPRILLLTGTPIQNNTQELWTLLNFIQPQKFYSLAEFGKEFGDLNTAEQIERLNTVLKPYLLRRMKEDVEKSIPPLQEIIIDIEMTAEQKRIYMALYENNKEVLIKGGGVNLNTCMNNLEMQLRKCCNHPFLIAELEQQMTRECKTEAQLLEVMLNVSGKMVLLDKLLTKTINEGGKMLIFSQFTKMLHLIEEYLDIKKIQYEKIDGNTKSIERQNSIDRFSVPGSKIPVFLLSTKAGGVGINLTSANIVVIFDSDWNPQNDVQATARAHRIGQENEVKVYRLITKKTYEAQMFERANRKLGLDQAIFMGGNYKGNMQDSELSGSNPAKKLSKQEMETLLKKGMIGFLEDGNTGEPAQAVQDIDDVLKQSRVAQYSLVNGSYTVAKSSFVANETDQELQIDDPNFWNLAFKNSMSDCDKVFKDYEDKEKAKAFGDYETQRLFMKDLVRVANKLIDSKIKIEGYSVDDDKKVNEILTKLTGNPAFEDSLKSIAYHLIEEIIRPSRRRKQFDLDTQTYSKANKGKAPIVDRESIFEEDIDDYDPLSGSDRSTSPVPRSADDTEKPSKKNAKLTARQENLNKKKLKKNEETIVLPKPGELKKLREEKEKQGLNVVSSLLDEQNLAPQGAWDELAAAAATLTAIEDEERKKKKKKKAKSKKEEAGPDIETLLEQNPILNMIDTINNKIEEGDANIPTTTSLESKKVTPTEGKEAKRKTKEEKNLLKKSENTLMKAFEKAGFDKLLGAETAEPSKTIKIKNPNFDGESPVEKTKQAPARMSVTPENGEEEGKKKKKYKRDPEKAQARLEKKMKKGLQSTEKIVPEALDQYMDDKSLGPITFLQVPSENQLNSEIVPEPEYQVISDRQVSLPDNQQ